MSAKILSLKEAKKRQLMRAKYASLLLTEMLLADEALVADQRKLPEASPECGPKEIE